MPGARTVPGRVMSIPCSADFLGAVGASRAASICCLSWLKRMPRAFLASAGADLSQASLMSLRRPCLRPSQWRRKASTSVVVGGADLFGEGGEGGVEGRLVEGSELRDRFVHGGLFRVNDWGKKAYPRGSSPL